MRLQQSTIRSPSTALGVHHYSVTCRARRINLTHSRTLAPIAGCGACCCSCTVQYISDAVCLRRSAYRRGLHTGMETAAIPPILYDMDEKTFLCAFILVVFYVFNFKHFLNVFNNKNVSVNVTQNSRSILMIFCVVYSFTTLCKIDGR